MSVTTKEIPPKKIDHINEIGKASLRRASAIEKRLFSRNTSFQNIDDVYYFIATTELVTDLFYSPITNIGYPTLSRLFRTEGFGSSPGAGEELILENIRNSFPLFSGTEGIVAQLLESVYPKPRSKSMSHSNENNRNENDGRLFFFKIEDNGDVKSMYQWCAGGLPPSLYVNSAGSGRVSEGVRIQLDGLGNALGCDAKYMMIVARDYLDERTLPARNCMLAQTGIIYIKGNHIFDESLLEKMMNVANVSYFSTLSLLYEKERYFQKSVRQAIRGQILKYGEREDVGNQIENLKTLSELKNFFVPEVIDTDPDYQKETSASHTWYRMKRYNLPNLLDLFTKTEGLKQYEIISITRACISHLRSTYWARVPITQEYCTSSKGSLLAALALAKDKVNQAQAKINPCFDAMEKRTPFRTFKSPTGIRFFEKEVADRFVAPLISIQRLNANRKRQAKISISWNGVRCGGTPASQLDSPAVALDHIYKFISTATYPNDAATCKINGGNQHGDAHFGNLMIDASVPEDPFVVSIDPSVVKILPDRNIDRILREFIHRNQIPSDNSDTIPVTIQEAIDANKDLRTDLCYDFGKLMLSTACCYGLAYHAAFSIDAKPNKPILLKKKDSVKLKRLNDVGGISTAHIVRFDDEEVVEGAWDYHQIAARVVIKEFIKLINETITSIHDRELNDAEKQEIAIFNILRLWLITVRHAFSIAEILIPDKMEQALTMYLLAARFLSEGTGLIEDKLMNGFCGTAADPIEPFAFAKKLFMIQEISDTLPLEKPTQTV